MEKGEEEGKVFVAHGLLGSSKEKGSESNRSVDFAKHQVPGVDQYLSATSSNATSSKSGVLALLKKRKKDKRKRKEKADEEASTTSSLNATSAPESSNNATSAPESSSIATSSPDSTSTSKKKSRKRRKLKASVNSSSPPRTPAASSPAISVFSASSVYKESPKIDFTKGQVEGAEKYLMGTSLTPRFTLKAVLEKTHQYSKEKEEKIKENEQRAAVQLVSVVDDTPSEAKGSAAEEVIDLTAPLSVESHVLSAAAESSPAASSSSSSADLLQSWPGIVAGDSLHNQICGLVQFLTPTPAETRARNQTVQHVFEICQFVLPEFTPVIFGSYVTGLCLPESDIDITLIPKKDASLNGKLEKSRIVHLLRRFARALKDSKKFDNIKVISKARIPLAKCTHCLSGIAIDVSMDSVNGVENSFVLQKAGLKYPALRPLLLVLKLFLSARGLNEPYSGGLGSYALALSLLSFLQNVAHIYPLVAGKQDLGALLTHYFHFYGYAFPYNSMAIAVPPLVESGELDQRQLVLRAKHVGQKPFFSKRGADPALRLMERQMLAIIDPVDPSNVVSSSAYNISSVITAFSHAYLVLNFSPSTGLSELLPPSRLYPGIFKPSMLHLYSFTYDDTSTAVATHLCLGSVFGWSLFNSPLTQENGVVASTLADWSLTDIMPVFSLVLFLQGTAAALLGKWQEKQGPRATSVLGGLCFGGGTLIGGVGVVMHSLPLLYFGYGFLGGIGIGLSYVPPVAMLIRWFPDQRGMATGMCIMGFGGGALVTAPIIGQLMKVFSSKPDYLGAASDVPMLTAPDGRRFESLGAQLSDSFEGLREVVVATAHDVASLPFAAEPGVYVAGTGSTGAGMTLVTMGAGYLAVMVGSAFMYRTPPDNYTTPAQALQAQSKLANAASSSSPSSSPVQKEAAAQAAALTAPKNVHIDDVMRTRQFWHQFVTFGCLSTAGMAVLAVAKTMMTEIFATNLPLVVTGTFATGYVAACSAANLSGRLGWSMVSDYIGRQHMFTVFTVGSAPLFLLVPYCAKWVADEPSTVPLALFYGSTLLMVSFFGAGYATTPAYEADLFGTKFVGAVHGRMLLASSAAALIGPLGISYQRGAAEAAATRDLAQSIDPSVFQQTFGAPITDLDSLIQAKTVTVRALMHVAPDGVIDPTPSLYNSTMYSAAALMCIAAVSNLTIRPVDSKWHMLPGDERSRTAIRAAEGSLKVVPGDETAAAASETTARASASGRNYVVCVDGTPEAMAAVGWALDSMGPADKLTLAHAAPAPAVRAALSLAGGEHIRESDRSVSIDPEVAQALDHGHRLLCSYETVLQSAARPPAAVELVLCEGVHHKGVSGDALLATAERRSGGILVIGCRPKLLSSLPPEVRPTMWLDPRLNAPGQGQHVLGALTRYCAEHSVCDLVLVKKCHSAETEQRNEQRQELLEDLLLAEAPSWQNEDAFGAAETPEKAEKTSGKVIVEAHLANSGQ